MFGKKSSSPKAKPIPLGSLPDAPAGVHKDPRKEFAEIYGGAKVGEQRWFLVAMFAVLLAIASAIGLVIVSQQSIAVPVLVEYNSETGVVNKPVRIEHITPSQAVVKAELGRWVTKVFTIDNLLSPRLMREANAMTAGLGTQQYADFRVKQNILERMQKDPSLQRNIDAVSVDVSQPGLAFVFVTTKEVKQGDTAGVLSKFRVTLKYQRVPPETEEEIMVNPLGVYVTSMNVIEEGAAK